MLNNDNLDQVISRCNTQFHSKEIIVNNVDDRKLVEKRLKERIEEGVIDTFYFVEDYIEKVLKYFSLNKDFFQEGLTMNLLPN